MKNPHRASEGAGKTQRGADTAIISPCNPCPYASDCRTHWIIGDAAEIADCAHRYQAHSRAELARMLIGRL